MSRLENLISEERLGYTPQFYHEAVPGLSSELQLAQGCADQVHTALTLGAMSAAEAGQRAVVSAVSAIDQRATVDVIAAAGTALSSESDAAAREALSSKLNQARSILMAPVVESARLSAILLAEKKPYQAEEVLTNALTASAAATAPKDSGNQLSERDRAFLQGLEDERQTLHVENHFDDMFAQFKSHISGKSSTVTDKDLQSAIAADAAAEDKDGIYGNLLNFLHENYKELTRGHLPFISKDGISDKDIDRAMQARKKLMNDMDIL